MGSAVPGGVSTFQLGNASARGVGFVRRPLDEEARPVADDDAVDVHDVRIFVHHVRLVTDPRYGWWFEIDRRDGWRFGIDPRFGWRFEIDPRYGWRSVCDRI